jgi:hypothetical protein
MKQVGQFILHRQPHSTGLPKRGWYAWCCHCNYEFFALRKIDLCRQMAEHSSQNNLYLEAR